MTLRERIKQIISENILANPVDVRANKLIEACNMEIKKKTLDIENFSNMSNVKYYLENKFPEDNKYSTPETIIMREVSLRLRVKQLKEEIESLEQIKKELE